MEPADSTNWQDRKEALEQLGNPETNLGISSLIYRLLV